MTNHPTPERLSAYLDDELEASVRAALDGHLRECSECGAHLADLAAVDAAAREVPLSVPERYFEDFAPRVRARLEKRTPARWRPPVWGWAVAAAAVLAVITPLAVQNSRTAVSPDRPAAEVAAPPAGKLLQQDKARLAETTAAPPAAPAAAGPPPTSREEDQGAKRQLERPGRDQADFARRNAGPRAGRVAPAPEPLAARQATLDAVRAGLEDTSSRPKEDERLEEGRALGYAAPPPNVSQKQHGPRAQNTVPEPPLRRVTKSAAESKDEKPLTADGPEQEAAGGAAGATQESVVVSPKPRDTAAGLASAKFRSLAGSGLPRSDTEARTLREAWRAFANANPDHPQADEARARLVEAGLVAFQLGRRPQDREITERDARAYLQRMDAPQAARVRAALKALLSGAP